MGARGDLHLPPAGDSTIGACAHLDAEVGGRAVQVRFLLPLGTTNRDTPHHPEQVAERLATIVGGELRLTPGARSEEWSATPAERTFTGTKVVAHRVRDREELLGPERCEHSEATWRPYSATAAPYPGMALPRRLECPRCLRIGIAHAPEHRFTDPPDPSAYIRGHRAYAASLGRRIRPDITLDALRAADAHISLDPADYATRPAAPASAPTRRRPARPGVLGRR